jgi:hypothetical protein
VSGPTVREEGTDRPKLLPEPPVLHREKWTVRDGPADRTPCHGPSGTLVRTVRKLHAPKIHRQNGSKERRSRTRTNTKNNRAVRHLADGPRRPRGRSVTTSWTVRDDLADGPPYANQHNRETEKQPPTCDRRISQTTTSLETKFWGDDENPKVKIFPKIYSL